MKECIKRNKSYKGGTLRPMLMGFEMEEWDKTVNQKRCNSPKSKRHEAIRQTQYHSNLGKRLPLDEESDETEDEQAEIRSQQKGDNEEGGESKPQVGVPA